VGHRDNTDIWLGNSTHSSTSLYCPNGLRKYVRSGQDIILQR